MQWLVCLSCTTLMYNSLGYECSACSEIQSMYIAERVHGYMFAYALSIAPPDACFMRKACQQGTACCCFAGSFAFLPALPQCSTCSQGCPTPCSTASSSRKAKAGPSHQSTAQLCWFRSFSPSSSPWGSTTPSSSSP